ncbi:thioredoxin [Alicyclobacillus fastidiosus]|uniref:Thioredoxin n=1 Tax=Alicyclobacillus fastidiosus TaxID=392011 RepID=A0ABY6ZKM0_9BACL|nr:thioredoxin [Alicyclobacillus fastidiosus]WAH42440.1 thioredoxin [Alicyclobacillus fastidiosus]GMA64266.1 thioredoxin [Alicyclobacillus fastidiosus]
MATVKVTDANFEQMLQGDKPVLVDFWATWCGPCKMMAPVLEELSSETEGKLTVAKLDVDENPATASKYGIMSIPTMIVFKNGQPVKQLVGYMPKGQLVSQLSDVI